ncbi:MAG: glycosyltransferase family 2 protein [Flavobacteriaceae bacterium]|jgi:glycosyltransferase involved in cell wall biosynthesis
MNQPLISIITASYNSEKTIGNTIESILNQTYKNIEYIIVDGASTDNTLNIIKSYQNKFRDADIDFKFISEPDKGVYEAWNKALKLTRGEWLVFLGSDDYFKSNTIIQRSLSTLKNAAEREINYVYGKIEHINNNGESIEIIGNSWETQKERFSYIMNVGHSGSFNHKSLFENHGKFNEEFKIAGDYEFLLREFKNKSNDAIFFDEVTIVMRQGGLSASLKNRLLLIKESYKARRINGINTFSPELFFWELKVQSISIISLFFGGTNASKIADMYRRLLGKNKRWSN